MSDPVFACRARKESREGRREGRKFVELELTFPFLPLLRLLVLQAVKGSSRIYLEAYTSILMVDKERLVRPIVLNLKRS